MYNPINKGNGMTIYMKSNATKKQIDLAREFLS